MDENDLTSALQTELSEYRREVSELRGRLAQATERLERAEDELCAKAGMQRLLDALPVAMALLSVPGYRYQLVTPAFEAMTGTPAGQLLGRSIGDVSPSLLEHFRSSLDESVASGEAVHMRETVFRANAVQAPSYWDTTCVPLYGASGEVDSILCVSQNVTEQALVRQVLIGSEQDSGERTRDLAAIAMRLEEANRRLAAQSARLQDQAQLLDLTHDGVFVRDLDGAIHYWNQGATELYGWQPEEALGQPIRELLKSVYPVPFDEILEALHSQGHWAGDLIHQRRDGSSITVASRWSLQRRAGEASRILEINTDITEQKQAQAQIAHQAELLEQISDAVIATDADGRITVWNRAAESTYGWSALDVRGQLLDDIIHGRPAGEAAPADPSRTLEGDEHNPDVYLQTRRDGSTLIVECRSMTLRDHEGRVIGHVHANRDITQRRRAETQRDAAQRQAFESQALFQALRDAVPDLVWSSDVTGQIEYVNSYWQQYTGMTLEQINLVGAYAIHHPEDVPALEAARIAAVQEKRAYEGETRLRGHDGVYRWFWARSAPLLDEAQHIVKWVGVFADIDDRMRAEEVLRKSEARLRAQYQRIPVPTYTWRRCGEGFQLVDYNDAAGAVTQGRVAQLLGVLAHELYSDQPEIPADLEACLAGLGVVEREMYYRLRTTGEWKWLAVRYAFVPPDEVMLYTDDITERKHAEQAAVRSAQRFELLHAIDQAILAAKTPDEIAPATVQRLRELIPCTQIRVLMFDARNRLARRLATAGEDDGELLSGDWRPLEDVEAQAIRLTDELFVVDDLAAAPQIPDAERLLARGFRSYLSVPLRPAGELIGRLDLGDRAAYAFGAETVEIARQVGASLAVAIQNAQLYEQTRRDREQLQALSRRLLQVQENERRWLARELHDDAGQALTAVRIGLGLVVRDSEDGVRLAEQVAELNATIDSAIDSLRRIALNLRPPALDRVGLGPAVEQYVARFREQTGLDVQVVVIGLEAQRLSTEIETNLYRMLQESLANVARHSGATRVDVVLEAQAQNVVLVVEDNGEGFDLNEALQKGHLGLVSLRERAEMMGGTLHIESALGTGTAVFVQVPISE